MLGDAEDTPTTLFQRPVDLAVTFAVPCDLGLPELAVSLGCPVALRAAVPKAPVDKERQLLLSEGEVGFARELQVSSPSGDAFLAEELYQHPFCPLVTLSSDPGHHLGSLLLGEDVRHGNPVLSVRLNNLRPHRTGTEKLSN